jgi:hypothetical protein
VTSHAHLPSAHEHVTPSSAHGPDSLPQITVRSTATVHAGSPWHAPEGKALAG